MNGVNPTGITVNKQGRAMTVTWNDGHSSTYSFSLLRHACPCEQCQAGQNSMSSEPPQEIFYLPDEDTPASRLEHIEPAGSYGISLHWEDGHSFGIYSWRYLRDCCPCSICQEMRIYGQ